MKIPIKIKSEKIEKEPVALAEARSQKTAELCQKISKVAIYLLTFLLPLFFLPWTSDILDFNKQILLIVLVFIALIAWLVKISVSGKLELNLTWLNIPVLFLFLIYGLSTLFSQYRYGSFWGWPLSVSAGFLSLVGFIIFYFLIGNIFKRAEVLWLLFTLIVSGFLASLFASLQLFGKFILPWDFAKVNSLNTIGTLNGLSIFLACLLPLILTLIFLAKKPIRVVLTFFVLAILAELVMVNFWAAWICLMVTLVMIFIFGMVNYKKMDQTRWFFPAMALLIIALFFLTFRISLPGIPPGQIEVSPSYKAELGIAKNTLSKAPIFGTGPGTFVYNFSKYKSADLNQTLFWNVRFKSGASEVLDKLITSGVLGILALFSVFVIAFWLGFKYLRLEPLAKNSDWLMGLGIFSSFSGIVLSQFLYPANLSLLLLFWIALGSFSVFNQKIKSWVIEPASPQAIIISFSLVLVIVLGLGLIFLSAQKYLAELKYLQGLKAWQRGESQQAINFLTRATNSNPGSDNYWRDLSQLHLVRINEIFQNPNLSAEEKTNQSQVFIIGAINGAKKATEISPEDVANWNVRGFIYRNLIGLVGGAEDWALKSYEKASELEKSNPYILTEIGRVYLTQVDILQRLEGKEAEISENLAKAEQNFQKALELKSDFAPAHFQLAMISVREGKVREAIKKLEETKQIAPLDTGLAFQIGLLYYNDKQFEKAKNEFERAVGLDPNYSNACYFLGLIYDKEGRENLAIEQFEKIAKLNPGNEEVKKILANLRGGKAALEGIAPAQPPIEEKPPETLKKTK